jgi:hypothetical protein
MNGAGYNVGECRLALACPPSLPGQRNFQVNKDHRLDFAKKKSAYRLFLRAYFEGGLRYFNRLGGPTPDATPEGYPHFLLDTRRIRH